MGEDVDVVVIEVVAIAVDEEVVGVVTVACRVQRCPTQANPRVSTRLFKPREQQYLLQKLSHLETIIKLHSQPVIRVMYQRKLIISINLIQAIKLNHL